MFIDSMSPACREPLVEHELVRRPMYLTASIAHGVENDALFVQHSPIVEWTDEMFRPIVQVLDGTCCQLRVKEEYENTAWMFGEYTRYEFQLFSECPGNDVHHQCQHSEEMIGGMVEQRGPVD